MPGMPPSSITFAPGSRSHQAEPMSAGAYEPPFTGWPGSPGVPLAPIHDCWFRKSTHMLWPAARSTADQETVSPLVRLASDGALIGPVMTATGGEPKLPALTAVASAGGVPAARLNGTVNGTVNDPPVLGGSGVISRTFCWVPYFLGSGATSPIVNVTSQSVGHFSVTWPERRTSACLGIGSSYRRTARLPSAPTGTACCSTARAVSRRACVCAAADTVSVMVRAAYHCGLFHAPWAPALGMTPAPCTGALSQPVIDCHSHAVRLLSTWPNSTSSPALALIMPPVQKPVSPAGTGTGTLPWIQMFSGAV